jgi:alpha-glucosidase
MLGPDLLVAPVLEEGAVDRAVTLPDHPGGWVDLADGMVHRGGTTARIPAPLGRLPVLVRAGALVPTAEGAARVLLTFGSGPARSAADLYEDDGSTTAWRSEGRHLRFERSGGTLAIAADSGRFRPAFDRIAVRAAAGAPLALGAGNGAITLTTEG